MLYVWIFEKAFDRVPHTETITYQAGRISCRLHGQILCWIDDFLSNTTQYVRVGDEHAAAMTHMRL